MPRHFNVPLKPLMAFSTNDNKDNNENDLPFTAQHYFELVDWTGRQAKQNKRGSIARDLPPLLDRLALPSNHWLERSTCFEDWYRSCRKAKAATVV